MVAGKWTATKTYNVINAETDLEACACVTSTFGVNIAVPHPDNPAMQLQTMEAVNYKGPFSWLVTTAYAIGDPGTPDPDPINQPIRLNTQWQVETIPADIDVSGNAILNSVSDPFDPPVPRRRRILVFTATRWEPFYAAQKAVNYMDTVNSDSFSIQGIGGFDPGQVLCDLIAPTDDYTLNALQVRIMYRFLATGGTNPWQNNLADKGRVAWFSDGGTPTKAPICDAAGNLVPFDVRLNGKGQPLDPQWMVWKRDDNTVHATIQNPTLPTGLSINASLSGSLVKTLTWFDKNKQAFTGLL